MFSREFKIDIAFLENPDFSAFFLLGPRQTGKSYLLKNPLPEKTWYINLLETDTFQDFLLRPSRLREIFSTKKNDIEMIIIDEIQKIPNLLDEVHLLLEEEKIKFILTGSSARKLKKQGVNLLGGRAQHIHFHPLVYPEIISDAEFDLVKILSFGTLPKVYLAKAPDKLLKSYCGTYLKEEIVNESLTRNLPAFSRFIEVAASCNSEILNYSQIASDAQVPKSTVIEYFSILEDTLIAKKVTPYLYTQKRKPLETPKFYFFDIGVARRMAGFTTKLDPSLNNAGKEFETYLFHELSTYIDYHFLDESISYWRTVTQQFEVDFVIGNKVAIEVKLSKNIQENDLKGLKALTDEVKIKKLIIVCRENEKRILNGVEIYPYEMFLKELWAGTIF